VGKNKPTLADVARLAGVSSATASRVMNNSGPVSSDVEKRIEAAMASLGYEHRKSPGAQAKEGNIAVLTGNLINPFFPEVVRGIQEEADNYGMILSLYNLTDHPQRQQYLIQKISRQNLDGIIVMGYEPFPALIEWQQKQRVPMVLLNRTLHLPYVHCISVDFANALYRATQHLLSLNHTRIGYIAAFHHSEIAVARRRGIEQALQDAGLSLRPEYCTSVPSGTEVDGGFQAMKSLLDLPVNKRPTALLAFNDVIALGALHAARVNGIRVPQELSVIGVDDIFASVYAYPPLTTIGQPKFRMGSLAIQRTLIVRESTGPAPLDNGRKD
jgi:LacI family transcriptional regulator